MLESVLPCSQILSAEALILKSIKKKKLICSIVDEKLQTCLTGLVNSKVRISCLFHFTNSILELFISDGHSCLYDKSTVTKGLWAREQFCIYQRSTVI